MHILLFLILIVLLFGSAATLNIIGFIIAAILLAITWSVIVTHLASFFIMVGVIGVIFALLFLWLFGAEELASRRLTKKAAVPRSPLQDDYDKYASEFDTLGEVYIQRIKAAFAEGEAGKMHAAYAAGTIDRFRRANGRR